jgi:large conductance mechanosensitive channel
MLKEFREFAMKGNVVDLAVGVIIGAAFGKIVSSMVADLFMPVLGLLTGGINFSDMAVTLKAADGKTPAVLLAYGKFLQNTFDFVIVAFAIFLLVKAINSFKRKQDAAPPAAPAAQEVLLAEIRDLLREARGERREA